MRICLLLALAAVACGKITPLKEPKKLDGLSGTANYYFSTKDNKCFMVIKEEYQNHPFVNVILVRDTIARNEEFSADILMKKKSYHIFLEDSTRYQVKREFQSWTYTFKPQESGLYEFKGHIDYDSIEEPFYYKFLVKE